MNVIAHVPGNVTYPTRNFATLGPSTLLLNLAVGPDHFCLALQLALEVGLYHPRMASEVWRIVSEDSIAQR